MGKTKRFSTIGMGVTNTLTPAPKYDSSNLELDSTHRVFPKNSFPKQSRWSTRNDEVASLSPSPSTYKLPSPNDARGVTPFMMRSPSGKMLDILKESKKSMAAKIGPGLYEPNP